MDKKFLLIGPSNKPITGQSYCFYQFAKTIPNNAYVLNYKPKSVLVFLIKLLKYKFFYTDIKTIYFTSSRSDIGFLRDLAIVLFFYNKQFKIIAHLHGADLNDFYKDSFIKKLIFFIYKRIDKNVILSRDMKDQFSNLETNEFEIVHNFSKNFITEKNLSKKINEFSESKTIKILYLSNIIRSKGIFNLLESLKYIQNKFTLDIAGNIFEEKEYFESLISNKYVNYYGVVQGDEKIKLLKSAHIIILPTTYPTEAQPICLIEGMAFGCIVISTKHNYIENFISNKNGYLLDSINPRAIANSIDYIYENKDFYANQMLYNVEYAKKDFSLENHTSKLLRILD